MATGNETMAQFARRMNEARRTLTPIDDVDYNRLMSFIGPSAYREVRDAYDAIVEDNRRRGELSDELDAQRSILSADEIADYERDMGECSDDAHRQAEFVHGWCEDVEPLIRNRQNDKYYPTNYTVDELADGADAWFFESSRGLWDATIERCPFFERVAFIQDEQHLRHNSVPTAIVDRWLSAEVRRVRDDIKRAGRATTEIRNYVDSFDDLCNQLSDPSLNFGRGYDTNQARDDARRAVANDDFSRDPHARVIDIPGAVARGHESVDVVDDDFGAGVNPDRFDDLPF